MKNKTALVTGGSGGIGMELAGVIAKNGNNIILVSRNEGQLKTVSEKLAREFGISADYIVSDLSTPSAPLEIYRNLTQNKTEISILVNNAGFGAYGKFSDISLEKQLEMIQVNITALTQLTRLFLTDMIKQGDGHILNVASTAAFQPGPLMAIYYASKAYVLSFSEALANELKGTGVTVTALCPGPTETGFQAVAGIGDSRLIKGRKIMDARTVAEAGYKAMMKGKSVVIPGIMNKMLTLMVRVSPRDKVTAIARWIQETRK